MMFLFSAIILVDLMTVFVAGESTAVISTTSGPVQGEVLTTVWHPVKYAAFKGIKYAEAPVGYLRFKPPVPVKPWTETFKATAPAVKCIQMDSDTKAISGSEDCLFLNVFTPVTNLDETPTTLKSVIVWIYGGAWVIGSSSSCEYNPDFLLARDVVVVSLNYRLGAFGFLSLNHPNATGNAALKDQNLALKWVQANIEKFGGNPNNVTIMGESAGAVSVGFHTLSDASAGLFHGAISMSGTPLVPWGFQTPEKALSRAEKLGILIGTNSTDKATLLKAFYNASAEELIRATAKDGLVISFTPTIENASIATDVFISECSIEKYYSGNFNKVPQLLGFMQQETVTFVSYANAFYEVVNDAIETLRDIGMDVPDSLEELLNSTTVYLSNLKHNVLELAVNETTDILFISPIDITQRILADYNGDNPVYYYRNSFYTNRNLHNIEYNTTLLGAGHTDDIAEVFYIPYANYNLTMDSPITRTIYRVATMWTNFAKYGNPTPWWNDQYPLKITWPDSGKAGLALDIVNNKLTVGPRPISDNVNIIELFSYLVLKSVNGCV